MALSPKMFLQDLKELGIEQFFGVPDSLLQELITTISCELSDKHHISAVNEGNALAMAAGYHMSTGKIAAVYFQNSGIGNIVNPLLSLCSTEVYSIPALLIIGWRGEPGVKDAPQHVTQGRIQNDLLESLGIEYKILSDDVIKSKEELQKILTTIKENKTPCAIVIKKGLFEKSENKLSPLQNFELTREEVLEAIVDSDPLNSNYISTTGKASRELFEIFERKSLSHSRNFYTVGSMGHSSSIALGLAIGNPGKTFVCIDGDGSMLMHLGSIAAVSKISPSNLKHILINNFAHESVGGQPTNAEGICFEKFIKSTNYKTVLSVNNKNELADKLDIFWKGENPSFIEIIVRTGSREDLSRPSLSPVEYKEMFMANILKQTKD